MKKIEAFKKRLGWRFTWVSSEHNDFSFDHHVSFTPEDVARGKGYYNFRESEIAIEELPGLSVFARNADGEIFHTYSTYSRGLDALVGTYQLIDLTPKGRDEVGLEFPMAWVRYHDAYEYAGGSSA